MRTSFIVPSAGFAKRLFPLSNNVPKILIRLNGVPLFSLLYKQAIEYGCINFIIAISQEFDRQLREFVENNYKNCPIPIIIRVVDNPNAGVLYSVMTAMNAPECEEYSLIVLSDTFYNTKFPDENNFVIYSEVQPPVNRWCLITTYNDTVDRFIDKPDYEVNTNKALIGVYKIHTNAFNHFANEIIRTGKRVRNEFQLSQALDACRGTCKIQAIKAEPGAWHDTGTLDTLREASNNFFLSRCFNHISINNGILTKSSEKKDVIQKQYLWYQNFQHKDLIPAIYGYSESIHRAEVNMELCAMPDLGTYFNYCNAEPKFFEQTIEYILNKLDTRLWSQPYTGKSDLITVSNLNMYVNKTIDRLNDAGINSTVSISSLLDELADTAHDIYCVPIHGDLILSNILFDPQRMTFKLIDPRGHYGKLGMFGDLKYELAKLLHSLNGKYESVIHNLYTINDSSVVFFMGDDKLKCFESAAEVVYKFAEAHKISRRSLKAIEASLFLSMIPLHSENKSHQEAFLSIANRLLKELYE